MPDILDRLKVLIESSTPIIVMETVEEMRAVRLVRAASSPLNLAVFEWSIASGLVRCGSDTVLHQHGCGGSRRLIPQPRSGPGPRQSRSAFDRGRFHSQRLSPSY